MKTRSLVPGLLVALTAAFGAAESSPARSRVIHVDARAQGSETGASWRDAYRSLPPALAVAARGDEIWVAEGTYRPTAGNDRAASFALVDGVAVLGGFAGTETEAGSRDPWARPTILSGNIGAQDSRVDDSLHVVTADAAVGPKTLLDGFVIEHGNALDAAPLGGGGIHVAGSPTFRRCALRDNRAGSGGAVYVDAGSPMFESCTFTGNVAETGGAVHTRGGATTLINVELVLNTAERGAAVLVESGSLELINATVARNAAERGGGALWIDGGAVLVHNSIVWGNASAGSPFAGFEPVVAFSDVEGGIGGAGNLAADPRFLDAERGDFRLAPSSPAIDAGVNALVPPAVTTALGGGPRVVAGRAGRDRVEARVDLGAREFDGTTPDTPGAGRPANSPLGPLADSDGDGVGDETDCRPLDPQAWAVPSPAWDLLADGHAPTALSWRSPASPGGMSVLYDVLRSTSPSDFSSALCIAADQSSALVSDSQPVSNVFYYLVRAKNGCGGNLGTDSALNPRTGAACSGPGQPCASDDACASGYCTDGFCCDSRCTLSVCESCALSGLEGVCSVVPAGTDPGDDCPSEPPSTCGLTGQCSGGRECEVWPEGNVCSPPSCADSTQLLLADTCDGNLQCVDGGSASCSPYTCSGDACLTSCASDGECSIGDCCSNVCLDTDNDVANCGTCGVACTNPHGGTSCAGGTCLPTCDNLWGSCDAEPVDGCETSLATLTDCGGCGETCSVPGAYATCETGSCGLSSCTADYTNCDGNEANGCEVYHREPSSCATAVYLGAHSGDENCGFICPVISDWWTFAVWQGTSETWLRVRLLENSTCPSVGLEHRFFLDVPPEINYDIYVYYSTDGTCNNLLECASSFNWTGIDEDVTCRLSDNWAIDDDRDLWIRIRHNNGHSCQPWTIYIAGHDC